MISLVTERLEKVLVMIVSIGILMQLPEQEEVDTIYQEDLREVDNHKEDYGHIHMLAIPTPCDKDNSG